MPQKAKNLFDFKSIIDQIKFLNFDFKVKEESGKFYLQAEFEAQDTITRKIETQHSRKWQLSPYMTDSEVVQTVFKCVLTSVEHETRESFTYQGCRIFSPHFDVNALVELCRQERFDEREIPRVKDDLKETQMRIQEGLERKIKFGE